LPAGTASPPSVRYAYRSFDRQFALVDERLGDFLRPVLWMSQSAQQLFMTSLLTGVLGTGPAAIATHLIPDMDHFRGSYGAKHVVPLFRDAAAEHPNVTHGVLELLDTSAEELFAYCYAVLSAPSYADRFAEELEIPGPRIPITRDETLCDRAVELGRELLWLHTFGERFVPSGERAGKIPPGRAKSTVAVPQTPDEYPESHRYDEETQTLHVGAGEFAPVSKAVREFSVSGLDVLGSWLDYRLKDGAGRRSSELDRIRPTTWPAEFSEELLRVLWILERTVELGRALDDLLDQISAGQVYLASELPEPTKDETKAPAV
ncbi:MAG: type ISP restriction/modification enzyme, partial [Gaiellaceae bacterium]